MTTTAMRLVKGNELISHSSEEIIDQSSRILNPIARRAYEIFESRGDSSGHDTEAWRHVNEVRPMKTSLILCLAAVLVLPLSTLFAARSTRSMVNVSYDKFEDFTQVSTNLSKVDNAIGRGQQKQDLRLQVLYACTGDTRHCRPDKVDLKFVSYSAAEHVGSHQLILIVDGKRMRVEPKWAGAYEGTGPPVEHITAAISLEEFLNVASAEKVEGKLGETTFILSDDNFAAIRAIASEMGLAGSRQQS